MPAMSHKQLQTLPGRLEAALSVPRFFCSGDGTRCAVKVLRDGDVCWKHPPCGVCSWSRITGRPAMPHVRAGQPCPYVL